ncbi:hypothetical protein LOTGIDRAFT_159635 [Lottia gigantea]|uniref:Small monomeric GTPase n=1 Tax=Lottia gigantea TaxID=225164 RepID=V4AT50_LOTGI|nr:hypothetical protein LOTGIDRAFT_159635 [Lottia gigantea]ESO96886.1 hypothetical protein LOTGIDRAFT_159635 [Lottia gigantea]
MGFLNRCQRKSRDKANGEPGSCVSVSLDGEESSLDFIDPDPDTDWTAETTIDAYVTVFSIDDRPSFERATDILFELKKRNESGIAVLLVGNKCDLVRTRTVTIEESKSVATMYDCKFVETSVVLNHNVDELLVGILTQIRRKKHKASASDHDHSCYSRSKQLLNKIFKKDPMSKSCEKLYGP